MPHAQTPKHEKYSKFCPGAFLGHRTSFACPPSSLNHTVFHGFLNCVFFFFSLNCLLLFYLIPFSSYYNEQELVYAFIFFLRFLLV